MTSRRRFDLSRNPPFSGLLEHSSTGGRWRNWLTHPLTVCLLLVGVTFAVYGSVRNCGFVNCDDPEYFSANPHVRYGFSWAQVKWAFSTVYFGNWLPLTWLSHMLDGQLFGTGPAEPHCVNLLLHAANGVLVFLLLRQLTGAHWRSAFVALLFALHPLRVESVAWVAERRDVLSAFFGLLSLIFYARYAQQQSSVERQESKFRLLPALDSRPSTLNYLLALFFFTCGLMTKAMVVTLPFVMLLLDGWPLKRVSSFKFQVSSSGVSRPSFALHPSHFSLLREKLPFFVLSVVLSIVTFFAQQKSGAVPSFERLPFSDRVGNALVSYARYVGKTFWPVNLALPYPHPGHWPVGFVAVAGAFVAILSVLAVGLRRKYPFVMTGWFWFLGMLIPVIGLIQTGPQAMADRFTYLPHIGLFLVIVWSASELFARWRLHAVAIGGVAATILVACALRTTDQLRYWKNSETLFRHAIAVTANNYPAYNSLGAELAAQGRLDEALEQYHLALSIHPTHGQTLNNLGNLLVRKRQFAEAIQCFESALPANSNPAEVRNNLGNALAASGRVDEAIEQFQLTLNSQPDFADAHNNLANALVMKGRLGEAVSQYREAIRYHPGLASAHSNLGYVLALLGKFDEAVYHCGEAVRLSPREARAHDNLGYALAGLGRYAEAVRHYEEALRLDPNDPRTHYDLGCALLRLERNEEAVKELLAAIRGREDYPAARQKLRELGVNAP